MDEYLAGYNETHNDVYLQTLAAATVISLNSDEVKRSHDEASRQQTSGQRAQAQCAKQLRNAPDHLQGG